MSNPATTTDRLPLSTQYSALSTRPAYLADAGLVMVTVIWGSTFVIVKGALGGVGPFEFVALRFAVAFAVLALAFPGRLRRLGRAELRAGAMAGAFLASGYFFQTIGLQLTTASKAGFITGLSVLLVPLVAFAVLRQRIGPGVAAGVVLAAVGLWLPSFDGDAAFGLGDLLMLGCAIAFACQIVSISAFAPRFDPIGLTIVQIGVVAATAGLLALAFERPLPAPTGAVWLAVLFTSLLGTALGLGLQARVQGYTTATHAALIFSIEPVFAALFAFWLAGEALGPVGVLGGGLMLAGMVVAEIRRG